MRKLQKQIMEKYEARYEVVGPGKHLASETVIIGRHIRFTKEGIEIEVDEKYVRSSLEAYGMENCKAISTPAVKAKVESKEERSQLMLRRVLGRGTDDGGGAMSNVLKPDDKPVDELPEVEAKRYQSIAAKLNFVSPDRPETLYATKECMRSMAKPTAEDEDRLKRLLRFYRGKMREAILMRKGGDMRVVKVFVDADFAGCPKTRRSTCGGSIMWGNGMLKAWSKTISTLALSSGESELAAMTKGAAEGLGLQSILMDFGIEVSIEVHSDATAAIGIASRQGLGRIRHVAVADLWVQQKLKDGSFTAHKVLGTENIADLMTKALDAVKIAVFLEKLGIVELGVQSYIDKIEGE